MSEINVDSRTQRILVTQSTGTVSVINGGPMGPGIGGPGIISRSEYDTEQAAQDSAIASLEALGLTYNSGTRAISIDGTTGASATLPLSDSASPTVPGLVLGSELATIDSHASRLTTAEGNISSNDTDISNNAAAITALQNKQPSRIVHIPPTRIYSTPRGAGSFILYLSSNGLSGGSSTINGKSAVGADFVFGTLTLPAAASNGLYVRVYPINASTSNGANANTHTSVIANGAWFVELDSLRRFYCYHQGASMTVLYDVMGWGYYY